MSLLRPAPKTLAQLAQEARGGEWTYADTRAALIACSDAGWDADRIYREVFRLLQIADSGPADLRALAARPARGAGGAEVAARGMARVMRALEQTEGYRERLEREAAEAAAKVEQGDVA